MPPAVLDSACLDPPTTRKQPWLPKKHTSKRCVIQDASTIIKRRNHSINSSSRSFSKNTNVASNLEERYIGDSEDYSKDRYSDGKFYDIDDAIFHAPDDGWSDDKEDEEDDDDLVVEEDLTEGIASRSGARMAQRNKEKENKTTATSLRVVSWNIALCRPSKVAHASWDERQQETHLLHEILRHQPDVIALQECPSPEWSRHAGLVVSDCNNDDEDDAMIRHNEDRPSYVSMGTRLSHCGLVELLIHQRFLQTPRSVCSIPLSEDLPAVAANLEMPSTNSTGPLKLSVSSCHLVPFRENADWRLQQAQQMVDEMSSKRDNGEPSPSNSGRTLLIIGDWNLRQAEEADLEDPATLGLEDVWKLAVEERHSRFTWNSRINLYHGPDAFAFH